MVRLLPNTYLTPTYDFFIDGQYIDNTGDIDYDQLYAQVLYELRELESRYWFINDELFAMKELGYSHSKAGSVTFYKVALLIAA